MPTRIFVAWALVSIAIVALLAVGMGIGYMIGRRQPAVLARVREQEVQTP